MFFWVWERECGALKTMQLNLNDSVLSLTRGDHGSKIWLNSGAQSVISDQWSPTCMFGLHSCHSNNYQLIHKAKKKKEPPTCMLGLQTPCSQNLPSRSKSPFSLKTRFLRCSYQTVAYLKFINKRTLHQSSSSSWLNLYSRSFSLNLALCLEFKGKARP